MTQLQTAKRYPGGFLRVCPGSTTTQLFVFFLKDLEDGIECLLCKDDTQLRGQGNASKGRIRFQNDLDQLEKWSEMNRMTFAKCKAKKGQVNAQMQNGKQLPRL